MTQQTTCYWQNRSYRGVETAPAEHSNRTCSTKKEDVFYRADPISTHILFIIVCTITVRK